MVTKWTGKKKTNKQNTPKQTRKLDGKQTKHRSSPKDSVLTQRLAAFATLGVVAGLMVQNAIASCRSEKNFFFLGGVLCLFCLCFVLFNYFLGYFG